MSQSAQPQGLCYAYAIQEAARDGGEVVHARCLFPPHLVQQVPRLRGERYDHAWVERDGLVYDWQMRDRPPVPAAGFYLDRDPVDIRRYDPGEAVGLSVRTGCAGPWTDAEVAAQRAAIRRAKGRRRV